MLTAALKGSSPSSRRAWIEITSLSHLFFTSMGSPSSRRAWIEIPYFVYLFAFEVVALLAEGVDRNSNRPVFSSNFARSPSSRRAWIEIKNLLTNKQSCGVALLAEGVDRNSINALPMRAYASRPPRGGRG